MLQKAFVIIKKEESDESVEKVTPIKEIIIMASGPIFSFMAAFLALILSYYIEGNFKRLVVAFAILSFATFINTAIPHRYKSRNKYLNGIKSDGLVIKEILRKNKEKSV